MVNYDELIKIQQGLEMSGNNALAQILSNALKRQANKNAHTIGFVGDDLVGKSTVINYILNKNILPTTVIPSLAEITIKYGLETFVYDHNETAVESNNLSQLIEEKNALTISTNSEYLKENSLEIKEFHGLLSKPRLSDMNLMAEVYKCDAVVLVIAAEHLLSESERLFIENYIKYVGSSHFLLVINKLSSVSDNDVSHVLDYAQNQISSKFPDIKWTIYSPEEEYHDLIAKYSDIDIKKEILLLYDSKQEENDLAIRNTLAYIKNQLEAHQKELENFEKRSTTELEKKIEYSAKQKELEETSIEEASIEVKQRRNNTIESIDVFIKDQFEKAILNICKMYTDAVNKQSWFENELENIWNDSVLSISASVDDYAVAEISKDLDWLNSLFNTKLGIKSISVDVPDNSLRGNSKFVPYGLYKKFAPIGIGGSVILGYQLFRMIGVAIGFGGGLLAYSYLNMKEVSQNEEILRKLCSKIREVSYETRKLSRSELEKLYAEVLAEFHREASEIIDVKYNVEVIDDANNNEKTESIIELIRVIEEV